MPRGVFEKRVWTPANEALEATDDLYWRVFRLRSHLVIGGPADEEEERWRERLLAATESLKEVHETLADLARYYAS